MSNQKMREALEQIKALTEIPFCHTAGDHELIYQIASEALSADSAARAEPIVPHQELLRVILVEAIRSVTGCPDIKGNDGKYLTDVALDIAKQHEITPPAAPVAPEYDRNAYEELRAIIDGGSESMTHSDAVEWCKRHADADWMPVKPAAPVAPEDMSPANVPMYWMDESSNACAYAAGFNACRRAMLAATHAPSQEPKQ